MSVGRSASSICRCRRRQRVIAAASIVASTGPAPPAKRDRDRPLPLARRAARRSTSRSRPAPGCPASSARRTSTVPRSHASAPDAAVPAVGGRARRSGRHRPWLAPQAARSRRASWPNQAEAQRSAHRTCAPRRSASHGVSQLVDRSPRQRPARRSGGGSAGSAGAAPPRLSSESNAPRRHAGRWWRSTKIAGGVARADSTTVEK